MRTNNFTVVIIFSLLAIFFFFIFMPIGVVLFLVALSGFAKIRPRLGTAFQVLGIIGVCLFVLFFIVFVSNGELDGTAFFLLLLIFLGPGILLYRHGRKIKKEVHASIQANSNTHLNSLAENKTSTADSSPENNAKMLENLTGTVDALLQKQKQSTSGAAEPKVVSCPGCGAKTSVIAGTNSECEYCGISL